MLKVLLTGRNGFVGSRFWDYYKDKYDLLVLNRNTVDMTNEKEVIGLFKQEKIDVVFHAGAISDIDECQNNPELAQKINVDATVNIAKACTLKNSILVYASSDQVYHANMENSPCVEDANGKEIILTPESVYAKSKWNAEHEIAKIIDRYYHLRLTWMFSYLERHKKTSNNFLIQTLRALAENTPMTLSDNSYRCMTYVYEVIENFEKIIQLPYGAYNAGSENELSNYEIGVKTLEYLKLSHRAKDIIVKEADNGQPRYDFRISNQKLRDCGVMFSSTEDGIKRCIEEFSL